MSQDNTSMTQNDLNAFLTELSLLTIKYKIVIGGCGCCGSPDLNPMTDNELDGTYRASYDERGTAESLGWEKRQ